MRRAVLMPGLGILAATVLSLPAPASGSEAAARPRHEAPAAPEIPNTAGGVPCSLIPVRAATAPVGTGPCPGVRPGGRVVTKVGLCTLNFLFRAPDGTRYIGTAAHCIGLEPDWFPEKVWPRGSGRVAQDADGKRIGEFAYAVIQVGSDRGLAKDFALIRLDPGVAASPEMCYFGGPRGVYTTDTADPVVLQYYGNGRVSPAGPGDLNSAAFGPDAGLDPGNGDAIGSVLPARSGVALGTPNPDHFYAAGLALPGDGGSGVLTADGLAIGVLVTKGLGTMGITRLGPQVARASEMLGVPLELVTAG